MKKPAIPPVQSGNQAIDSFASAVKQSIDTMTGQFQNATPITPLDPSTATTADCARQLNLILERIQGS